MLDDNKKLFIIIRGIIVFLIFWFSAYFQYIPIKLFHLDIQNLSPSMNVVLSTFSSLIVVFFLFFIYRKELKIEFKKFKSKFWENLDIGFRYWMIGLIIMMVSNFIINFVFKAGEANNETALQEMIKSLPWLMVIDAGLLAPFNEEIVFRKIFKDVIRNPIILVSICSIVFGAAHVVGSASTWLDYLYIIPYGALGGAFAYSYYKTDTVFTSMSMHMIHNTVLVILSILAL